MAVVADLHVHTTHSDGSLSLGEVVSTAPQVGLDAVAITDHDRLHPHLEAPVMLCDELTVIAGIELRVEADENVDLLGYGVTPTVELQDEIDRLQRDRIARGTAIIERVEDRLWIDLDLDPRAGLGRPHIARAIAAHPDAPYDVQGAFDHLIGDDGPCFVARSVPSFDRGRRLLRDSCALVGLAHPLRYQDPESALSLCATLDAVERWYPYDRPVTVDLIEEAIDAYDLVPTGGSDAHDDSIGKEGLAKAAYRRFRSALSYD